MTIGDFRIDLPRKKQLGQYFTGRRVGRLLAALAGAEGARTIIDPMVGSGDLLAACLEVGATPDVLIGFDLDPAAIYEARAALAEDPRVDLTASDAFTAKLPTEQFDLVITNPPYIRYQSNGEVDGISVPSASSVRGHLVQQIQGRTRLPEDMRELLLAATNDYPGTSDVAVPAWILSAALVRDGGVLAVVAPQTWLSRNYAHAVRDLLDKAFDVELLIEDGDATWFDDAQVRTNLVIARRRSLGANRGHSIVVARATRDLDTHGSLIGTEKSESALADAVRRVKSPTPLVITRGLTGRVTHDISLAARQGAVLPASVASATGEAAVAPEFRTLESYGWRCGQGLRTGANDFFYLTESEGQVKPAARWGSTSVEIPNKCIERAVRRQSDLGEFLDVRNESPLKSRVLNLRGWVTQADSQHAGDTAVRSLPQSLSKWIDRVAVAPLSDLEGSKKFPELVAVATNAKTDRAGRPTRFWYQLPPFAPRHRPALFIPRVCGGRPVAYVNSAGVLIDANFSTLWPIAEDAMPVTALFALLNSTWAWANLEVSSTVLGGGALKVEASDLRRLPLPELGPGEIAHLSRLGTLLHSLSDTDTLREVDRLVAAAIAGPEKSDEVEMQLAATAERARQGRSK